MTWSWPKKKEEKMKKTVKRPMYKGDQLVARLCIYKSKDLSTKEKKAIARWLKDQAEALIYDGMDYSDRYSARYLFAERKSK